MITSIRDNVPNCPFPSLALPSLSRVCSCWHRKEDERTCSAANKAFLYLGAALVFNTAVLTFVAAPPSIILMTGLTGVVFAGMLVNEAWKHYSQKENSSEIPYTISRIVAVAAVVNTIGKHWLNNAIHESGHYLSSLACFLKADPKMGISYFQGGRTKYNISYGLTQFGSLLGKEGSLLFTTAAGLMASTLFAMIEIAIAHGIRNRYPILSEVLNAHAFSQLVNDLLYSLTAFISKRMDFSHDLLYLWHVGDIHPLIPISLMIILPLAEVLLLKFLVRRNQDQKTQNIAQRSLG